MAVDSKKATGSLNRLWTTLRRYRCRRRDFASEIAADAKDFAAHDALMTADDAKAPVGEERDFRTLRGLKSPQRPFPTGSHFLEILQILERFDLKNCIQFTKYVDTFARILR
jgi:hypothetical protein